MVELWPDKVMEEQGLFYGWDGYVWLLVGWGGIGGMFVALVIKHADNILRGFSASISAILAAAGSKLFLGTPLPPAFLIGSAIVLTASAMYARDRMQNAPAADEHGAAETQSVSPRTTRDTTEACDSELQQLSSAPAADGS